MSSTSSLIPVRRAPKERPGPPGGKRDVNRQQRTDAIARAALDLFLEKGVEAVTIDDIAKHANIAKGSFYRYFDDKNELVAALIEPIATAVADAMQACEDALEAADSRARLVSAYQTLGINLMPIALAHLDTARLYLQEARAPGQGAREPIRKLALDIEERAIRLTEIAVRNQMLRVPDPRVSALAVIGMIEQLAIAYLNRRLDAPLPLVASSLIDLVLEGIRVR